LQLGQLFNGFFYKLKLRQLGKKGFYVKFGLAIPSRFPKKFTLLKIERFLLQAPWKFAAQARLKN
jgi:hypothetical protein